MKRPRNIPPRTPVFLGCEGKSETGYGALLGRIAQETPGVHIYIHVELLQPGAGDPLELVRRAAGKIAEIERKRVPFGCKAVLLDYGDSSKNAGAVKLAQECGIEHLVWQYPDHEALLLRHLDGCRDLKPPKGNSLATLRRHWPEYQKASTALRLAERITLAQIRQACAVEPELSAFLTAIGLI